MIGSTSSDSQLTAYIYGVYTNQYFPFMDIDEMCSFDVIFIDDPDWKLHDGACVECPKPDRPGYTLSIERSTLIEHKQNGLPILFHEFTHIYDREILLKDIPQFQRTRLLELYTEYHATIVQMQAATGIPNKPQDAFLRGNSLIADRRLFISLFSYLENEAANDMTALNTWCKSGYEVSGLENTFTHFMYSAGRAQFAKLYCIDPIPELTNNDGFTLVFGDKAVQLLSLLQTTPMTVDTLSEIERLHTEIGKETIWRGINIGLT